MGLPRDRANNRKTRRGAKQSSNEPLLRLVYDETVRKERVRPTKLEIAPKNKTQLAYDTAIASKGMTFGVGPAGTGKTWLAVMRAAQALDRKEIVRIIITRPAMEAGESLGFLPGEIDEKYEPYFRPVREAFEEFFGSGHLEYLIKSGVIEARPLGLLRGSSLKNTWLIADEMQNATKGQMKMLTSRIGEDSKFIINGDPTQCDLPDVSKSGLEDAIRRFSPFNWFGLARFTRDDIVRSGICRDVICAYDDEVLPDPRYNSSSTDESDLSGMRRMLKAWPSSLARV